MPLVRLFALLVLAASTLATPIRIACVGDSITEGSGLGNPSLESYPARLQRLLGITNFTVSNFGVSGRTLLKKGDFPYWNEVAFTNSRTFGPNIVIIQLGTNDSKPYNWKYGTNFLADYRELISIYAALPSAPAIFLCTPCPVYLTGAYDIVPGVVHTNIAPAVRDLAVELNLPLIDLHLRMTNSAWFPDTVHPDSKGSYAMAAVMYETLFPPPAGVPTLTFDKQTSTRIILSWPQVWGCVIHQQTTTLGVTKTAWSIIETSPPIGDGVTIRQTNFFSGATRFFQVRRP